MHNSGIARINLYKKYPDSLKLVHLLPAVFTLGVALLLLGTPSASSVSRLSFSMHYSYALILLFRIKVCLLAFIPLPPHLYSLSAMVQAFGAHGGSVVSEGRMSLRLSKRIFISNPFLFAYYHSYFCLKGMLSDTRVSDKLYFHGKKSNGCNRRNFYRLYLFSFSGVQITFLILPLNPSNLSPICFNGKISVS